MPAGRALLAARGKIVRMRLKTLIFLIPIVLASACKLTSFDVSQNIPAQTIPGSPLGGLLPPLSTQQININSQIQSQTTSPIGSVKLKSLVFTITAGDDWRFLSTMDIYISSTKAGTTLPAARIATVSNPGATNTLNFTVLDVELNDYVSEGSQLSAMASGNAPADDTTFDGVAVFTVDPF
jgi:hypothetical protein